MAWMGAMGHLRQIVEHRQIAGDHQVEEDRPAEEDHLDAWGHPDAGDPLDAKACRWPCSLFASGFRELFPELASALRRYEATRVVEWTGNRSRRTPEDELLDLSADACGDPAAIPVLSRNANGDCVEGSAPQSALGRASCAINA